MLSSDSFFNPASVLKCAARSRLVWVILVLVWNFNLIPISETFAQSLVADGAKLELASDAYRFTEGPAVDKAGNVYFTDQPNDRILKYTIAGEIETWLQPAGRSNGLFFDHDGNLLACADGKNELWRIAPDKSHKVLLKDYEGKLFNGPNDLWVAGDGVVYITDPYYKRGYWERSGGPQLPKRVYKFDPETGDVSVAAEDFKQPNGIVGDPKKKLLYVADIGDKKTYRFQIADDGTLTRRELFCESGSDGMTLDQDGNLYITGKGVFVFNQAGEQIEHIDVPEGWTANVCFGGTQRDILFITASDSLYTLKMKTRGL